MQCGVLVAADSSSLDVVFGLCSSFHFGVVGV